MFFQVIVIFYKCINNKVVNIKFKHKYVFWIRLTYIHIRCVNQRSNMFGLDLDIRIKNSNIYLTNWNEFGYKLHPLTSLATIPTSASIHY